MELTTARLRLRPFTFADEARMHEIYSDPEVMRYVGHGPHRTVSETTAALRAYSDMLARRGYSFLAVTERDGGAIVGDAGLHPFAGTGPDVELGYTLARSAWGKGYATEAAEALVDHAFGPLGLPRVLAQVEPANTGSRHVLDKLGMEERGRRLAYGRPHLLYVLDATRRASPRASPPR